MTKRLAWVSRGSTPGRSGRRGSYLGWRGWLGGFIFPLLLGMVSPVVAWCHPSHNHSDKQTQTEVDREPVLLALSRRDFGPTLQELRTISGSDDRLVHRLLELRAANVLPFVQVRAAKNLVAFASRAEVQRAILDDVQAPDRFGLVRVYARAIDELPKGDFRREFAARVIERGQHEKRYQAAVRLLLNSQDPDIRSLAVGHESLAPTVILK